MPYSPVWSVSLQPAPRGHDSHSPPMHPFVVPNGLHLVTRPVYPLASLWASGLLIHGSVNSIDDAVPRLPLLSSALCNTHHCLVLPNTRVFKAPTIQTVLCQTTEALIPSRGKKRDKSKTDTHVCLEKLQVYASVVKRYGQYRQQLVQRPDGTSGVYTAHCFVLTCSACVSQAQGHLTVQGN